MVVLDVLVFISGFVLLLAAVWLLQQCDRLEVSFDSVLALTLGIASASAIGRAFSTAPMELEYVTLLVVGALWVLRTFTRRRRAMDRRATRAPS